MLINININVILGIIFFIYLDINVQFARKKLIEKNYMTVEALPTIKKLELINKKEFVIVVLNINIKIFVIYVLILKIELKILINFLGEITIQAKY